MNVLYVTDYFFALEGVPKKKVVVVSVVRVVRVVVLWTIPIVESLTGPGAVVVSRKPYGLLAQGLEETPGSLRPQLWVEV